MTTFCRARRRPRPLLALGLALFALPGCGDEATSGASLVIWPRFVLGSDVGGCAEAPGVRELEITLFDETGAVTRSGYPQRVPCADALSIAGPSGRGELLVVGLGPLDDEPDGRIFIARTQVELPGGEVSVELTPEVAFLTLDWTFGDRALEPCASEVAEVQVIVSAAAGGNNAFEGNFACDARPLRIETPLSLVPHTVQVRATSAGGYPIYTHTMPRVFDRGLNAYTAVLAPFGGQILLDWTFALADVRITACDDVRVEVDEVEVEVQGLALQGGEWIPDGSPPVIDAITCTSARPAPFLPARFVAGRELAITLQADGVHRFLGGRQLTMPAGDAPVLDVFTLDAVGTATGTVSASSPGCAGLSPVIEVFPEGSGTPIVTVTPSAPDLVFTVADLPYGTYRVTVGTTPSSGACPAQTFDRAVDARTASWGTLSL